MRGALPPLFNMSSLRSAKVQGNFVF